MHVLLIFHTGSLSDLHKENKYAKKINLAPKQNMADLLVLCFWGQIQSDIKFHNGRLRFYSVQMGFWKELYSFSFPHPNLFLNWQFRRAYGIA